MSESTIAEYPLCDGTIKTIHFQAHPKGDHTLALFINGVLDQYVTIDDAALDSMIEKRDALRARLTEDYEDTAPVAQCQICGCTLDISGLDERRNYVCKGCRARNPRRLIDLATAPLA